MATDYIPKPHDKFFVWQGDFYNRAQEKLNSFQIDAGKFQPVTAAKSKYELAFHRASNPEGANASDRVERDEREAEYKAVIRGFVNENIRFNSRVSDYDRKYLGLTIPDSKPTPSTVPATHPVIEVDFSETRVHTLHIRDEHGQSKAKPHGVRNCELWSKVGGDAPADDSELTLAGTASSGKLRLTYAIEQTGLRVYYQARWVSTRSEAGEFGEVVSAIIA